LRPGDVRGGGGRRRHPARQHQALAHFSYRRAKVLEVPGAPVGPPIFRAGIYWLLPVFAPRRPKAPNKKSSGTVPEQLLRWELALYNYLPFRAEATKRDNDASPLISVPRGGERCHALALMLALSRTRRHTPLFWP